MRRNFRFHITTTCDYMQLYVTIVYLADVPRPVPAVFDGHRRPRALLLSCGGCKISNEATLCQHFFFRIEWMHTELALVMQLYGLLQLFEPFAIIWLKFLNYMAYIFNYMDYIFSIIWIICEVCITYNCI